MKTVDLSLEENIEEKVKRKYGNIAMGGKDRFMVMEDDGT